MESVKHENFRSNSGITLSVALSTASVFFLAACAGQSPIDPLAFRDSGSVTLSSSLTNTLALAKSQQASPEVVSSPLVGFLPPTKDLVKADTNQNSAVPKVEKFAESGSLRIEHKLSRVATLLADKSLKDILAPLVGFFSTKGLGTSKSGYTTSGTKEVTQRIETAIENRGSAPHFPGALIGYLPPASGFLPSVNQASIEIDRESRTISLFRGAQRKFTFPFRGSSDLERGSFSVSSINHNPLWVAPDSYYLSRALPLPVGDNSSRYFPKALGSRAIFVAGGIPIHDGQVSLKEVGGLRVTKPSMNELFKSVRIGSPVVIR